MISLVTITCNDDFRLEWVLEGVKHQRFKDFEFIIVNDGGDNQTESLVEKYSKYININYIYLQPKTDEFRQAKARNFAAKNSRGNKLVFIDGDCVIPPEYLLVMNDNIQNGVAVYGMRLCIEEHNFTRFNGKFDFNLLRDRSIRDPSLAGSTFSYSGGFSMGFSTKDYCRVGGANEVFLGWGPDDVELWFRLEKSGVNRKFLEDRAVVIHLNHPRRPQGNFDREVILADARNNPDYVRNGGPLSTKYSVKIF